MRIYLSLKKWKWWQLHVCLLPLASVSGMDGPIKSLKEKLEQNDVAYANELKEKNSIIECLRKEIEDLGKEMMEDKINLSEAGDVIENFIQENTTLREQLKVGEDSSCTDKGLRIKELALTVSELEKLVEEKNNDIAYWKRQTSRQGHQKLDLRRQASMNSSRPSTPNCNEEVEKLKNDLAHLKESHARQVEELEEKVDYYKKQNQQIRHENAGQNTTSELRVAEERITELEDEVNDLNQRIVRLQSHCYDVERELSNLRFEENNLLDEAEDKFRSASREASAKCHNLEYLLENERKKLSRLEESNDELKRELLKSTKAANTSLNEVEKLKSKLSKTRIMLNDARLHHKTVSRGVEDSGIAKLQKIIDENDVALKVLTRAKSELECELADCRILLDNYKHSRNELEDRLKGVSRQMSEYELLVEDKQIEVENAQRTITSLKLETSLLGDTVDIKEAEISTLKKQIVGLRERVSGLESDSALHNNSTADNSSMIEGLRSKLDLSETQKNRFQIQLRSARAELMDVKQETEELNMKIIQLNDQLRYSEKRTTSLEKEREMLNEDKQDLSDKMVKLQRETAFMDETSQELKNENSLLRKRLLELQNSIKEDIKDSDSSNYVYSSDNETSSYS